MHTHRNINSADNEMGKYRLPRTFNRNALERLEPLSGAGRVIESVRSRLNRCTMRNPLVSSRGVLWPSAAARRVALERSDDPARPTAIAVYARTRAFHYSINRPTRPERPRRMTTCVSFSACKSSGRRIPCTILRKYGGWRRRLR